MKLTDQVKVLWLLCIWLSNFLSDCSFPLHPKGASKMRRATGHVRMVMYLEQQLTESLLRGCFSPNQVLTHAARAAAKQLNKHL